MKIARHYCSKRLLIVVVLVVVATLSGTALALALPGPTMRTISGTVVMADTDLPPQYGFNITVTDFEGNHVAVFYSSGNPPSQSYSVTVPPGQYKVRAGSDPGSLWYMQVPVGLGPFFGDTVNVTVHDATNINFSLPSATRTLSGKVVDSRGRPILDVHITLYDAGGHPLSDSVTAVDGRYMLRADGIVYYVRATADGYSPVWYRGVAGDSANFAKATAVDLTRANVDGIDFTLKVGSSVEREKLEGRH